MALRKQRMHSTGVSNLDHRVKEEWKRQRTARPVLFESKHKYHDEQLGVRPPLSPAPDLSRTMAAISQQKYYESAGRPVRPHPQLQRLQTAPLAGLNLFVGGDNDPFIYMAQKKPPPDEPPTGKVDSTQHRKLPKYYRTKDVEHKQAIQETQLVHTQHEETLEGKVDLSKVVDIRRTIRRRYANRSNFRMIFNQWDRDSLGVIRTDDVHFMVNQLGIPINKFEAQVLVASANQSGSGALNLDEFLQLIFDDSNRLNVDLSSLKVENPDAPAAEAPQAYSDGMLREMHELAVNQHTRQMEEQLKLHIKARITDVTGQMLRKDKTRSGAVSFDKFCEVMNNLSLPHTISNQKLWSLIYTEFGGREDGINYKDFMKHMETFEPGEDALDRFQEAELTPHNPYITEKSAGAIVYSLRTDPNPVVLDPQRVPANKIEAILVKSRRICNFLKDKFPNEVDLREILENRAKNGIISQSELKSFVEETTKKDANFLVTKSELENFLSRYIYNKQGQTSVNAVTFNIYNDDVRADTALQRRIRAIPPSDLPPFPAEPLAKGQLKRILTGLDEKIFTQGVQKTYKAFKIFDADNDGYLNFEDLRKGLETLSIPHTQDEARALMGLLDEAGKGYVEYKDFARVVRPNTAFEHAEKLDESAPLYANYVQPSKAFLTAQLNRTGEVDKAYEELRKKYKPNDPTFVSRPSTRFGSTPDHQNTFLNFVPPEDAGMYLDDKARLTSKSTVPINVGNVDREARQRLQEAKSTRIRQTLTSYGNRISQYDAKLERMDEAKIGVKAAFREMYEKVRSMQRCHLYAAP